MLSVIFANFKPKHNSNQTRENATDKEHHVMFTVHSFSPRAFSNLYFKQESNRIWLIIPMKIMLGCSLAFDRLPNTQAV